MSLQLGETVNSGKQENDYKAGTDQINMWQLCIIVVYFKLLDIQTYDSFSLTDTVYVYIKQYL